MSRPRWTTITDADDPRLDHFRNLRDAAARRTHEAEHGLFVAEGPTVIRRLVQSAYPVRTLLLLPSHAERLARDGVLEGLEPRVLVADRAILAAVAGFDVHRGALAIAERRPPAELAALLRPARLVAVLEGLSDAENLGAVARSASALGVDGLVLDPTCTDPLYRRTVRVSMGEVLFLPWTRLAPWPARLEDLRLAGFTLVALTPATRAEPLEEALAAVSGRVALLLGAEGPGLSSGALAAADRWARIPLRPGVDSLNVGHAAAIAFDAARRRTFG